MASSFLSLILTQGLVFDPVSCRHGWVHRVGKAFYVGSRAEVAIYVIPVKFKRQRRDCDVRVRLRNELSKHYFHCITTDGMSIQQAVTEMCLLTNRNWIGTKGSDASELLYISKEANFLTRTNEEKLIFRRLLI